jgi:NAD(P)-dependent dehydrogenase (short-subunit alcohol dehydrogenase family)
MTSRGVAIVTGAAQNIGKSISLKLAEDGYNVTLNDLPSKQALLDDVAKEIREKSGKKAIVVPGDVSKEEDVAALVDTAVKELGGLDVVRALLSRGKSKLMVTDGSKCRHCSRTEPAGQYAPPFHFLFKSLILASKPL